MAKNSRMPIASSASNRPDIKVVQLSDGKEVPFLPRMLKKIRRYHKSLKLVQIVKLLLLIALTKAFARRFSKWFAGWRAQKFTLEGFRHPIFIRPGTTDVEVMQQVLLDKEYDFQLPTAPKVIVDAGANIGLAAVYLATVFPDATIFALEPERSNFELMVRNTEGYSRIKALHAALWNVEGQINLLDPHGGHCGFRTSDSSAGPFNSVAKTQALTVDSLMRDHGIERIELLKVDIEGAEREVFNGSAHWINKVEMIMVELHDETQPGCSEAFYKATENYQSEIVMKGETILRQRSTHAAMLELSPK
jgi:FkbM family methyltransferase